jgi:imidazole glycerol-phosphate synthase subunit HisH
MLTIVNYGVGNLSSMQNMLKKIGVSSIISNKKDEISTAEKLILPGVGAFDTCADRLKESGLIPVLNERVIKDKIPVLGVCVGMQLMLDSSEEGIMPGLGWIKGKIVRFNKDLLSKQLKIPHMGWAEIGLNKKNNLLDGIQGNPRYYFVHSYHASLEHKEDELFFATHGYQFTAGIQYENITGVQFHPEKSHKFGMKLLSNFATNN